MIHFPAANHEKSQQEPMLSCETPGAISATSPSPSLKLAAKVLWPGVAAAGTLFTV